ncbi:MAG: hypothetical protein ACE5I3_10630 [Phycisphaerae bacterium]
MPDTESQSIQRFTILCRRCDRAVLAREAWIGREVQCPHCYSLMRVPDVPADGRPVPAEGPNLSEKRCFNFACPRCDCLLEGHTGMSGRCGTCPTCAARFTVPYLQARSGRPQKATLVEGETEGPVPLHAYAASGHQAPQIVRRDDGTSVIACPRCNAHNPIDADTCAACGTPFTMEAAPTIGKLRRDSRASSSITLGVVALVVFPALIPGMLATWLGLRSVMFGGAARRSTLGFVGLTLGLLSLIAGVTFWYFKLK